MTEITKDRDFKTNIELESQTIDYIKNPEKFKEDLTKAKNEITDMGNVVKNTINPPGEDKRNIFANLRAQRGATTFYNVVGSRAEALNEALKNGTINEEQFKEEVREVIKGYGKDIGVDFEVVYLDEATMPKHAKGSTGAAFIDKETGKMLIPIDVNKVKDTGSLWGVIAEEVSHIKDGLAGRQDKKVAEDETNKEKGLESLGRPVNDYVKDKLGNDNSSDISLTTDGIDLTNANVGEKVGDVAVGVVLPAAGIVIVAGLMLPEENKEAIKKVTMEVYEDTKKSLNKLGNNIKISYAVVKSLIEKKLREKGIIADVKIDEDKDGNIVYTVSTSDKRDNLNEKNSKLSNPTGININEASSSNDSDKKSEKKEENINKDDKGSEDSKNNKEPNNDEEKSTPKKSDNNSKTALKLGTGIGTGAGAAYETNSRTKNSNNKNTTNTAQENLNTNNQSGQVSQNNRNSINKPQTQGSKSNVDNQQISKGATSSNQQETPVSKTPIRNDKSDESQEIANTKQDVGGSKVQKNGEQEIKPYYETKKGNPKAKKYLEKGETLEQHYEKYAIENVKNKGINIGRSKEHSNTTVGHWEKSIDLAEEASKDPNVKAVYVDETLKNISPEIFKNDNTRPDVTIEYNDGTFTIIEVQSKTDTNVRLLNKLKKIQNEYGKDVVKDYKVEKPKGRK